MEESACQQQHLVPEIAGDRFHPCSGKSSAHGTSFGKGYVRSELPSATITELTVPPEG